MRPRPRAIIPGSTARAHSTGPRTFTSITCHHSPGSLSTKGPILPSCPALLTSTSTGPSAASILSIARRTPDVSVTSTANACASPDFLISAAVSSISDWVRARAATLAPACARASATARPIPRPAPVTTATRPSRSVFILHRLPAIPKQIAPSVRHFPPSRRLSLARYASYGILGACGKAAPGRRPTPLCSRRAACRSARPRRPFTSLQRGESPHRSARLRRRHRYQQGKNILQLNLSLSLHVCYEVNPRSKTRKCRDANDCALKVLSLGCANSLLF